MSASTCVRSQTQRLRRVSCRASEGRCLANAGGATSASVDVAAHGSSAVAANWCSLRGWRTKSRRRRRPGCWRRM
eukprot:3151807-Pleurochrysis_carterae.AAC.1